MPDTALLESAVRELHRTLIERFYGRYMFVEINDRWDAVFDKAEVLVKTALGPQPLLALTPHTIGWDMAAQILHMLVNGLMAQPPYLLAVTRGLTQHIRSDFEEPIAHMAAKWPRDGDTIETPAGQHLRNTFRLLKYLAEREGREFRSEFNGRWVVCRPGEEPVLLAESIAPPNAA